MDPGDSEFVSTEEAAEIEAQKREALRQMDVINDKIESVKKKLKRLEEVKNHLKISYDSRFRKIDYGERYAGRWRRSDSGFNSRLTGNVREKADLTEATVNYYVRGPLDPILEGVHGEGLKREIRALIDLRKRVVDRQPPILDFASLLSGWPPQCMETQRARLVRNDLGEREARSKERLFTMLVFLVLYVMESEYSEGRYRRFASQLELVAQQASRRRRQGVAYKGTPLISKCLILLKEARERCLEMISLGRVTRNILECYSSMLVLIKGELSEFLELFVERMAHLDTVLQDIPRRRAGDCIFLQLEWGGEMMTRCEETVHSISEQMWLVYGPCLVEWESVIATWTRAALAT